MVERRIGGKVGLTLTLTPNLNLNKNRDVSRGSDNPVALIVRLGLEPRKARKGC